MREFSVPAAVSPQLDVNTTMFVERLADSSKNPALFSVRKPDGERVDVTAREFRDDAKAIVKGLVAHGVQPGDRVAIMSRTRFEWTLLDFAIWYAGAVSVPIYESASSSQIAWNLSDSAASVVFVETQENFDSVERAILSEGLESVREIFTLVGNDLDTLRTDGRSVSQNDIEKRGSSRTSEDLATIIYTSGTTGKPKGAELTHANFVELTENALAVVGDVVSKPGSQTIMFLPLAHVFGRMISVLNIAAGAKTSHSPDIKHLVSDFQEFPPTYILAVPRVFEKVYNSALLKSEAEGKGKIFALAAKTAVKWSQAAQRGQKVPFLLNLKHAIFGKLVYGKLRNAMGGKLEYAVSGGGPLGTRLGHFYHGIGVTILEGYGLTETTAPLTVNTPADIRIGTVGRPLPGNAVKIADDGEIYAKGVCVMRGYHNRDDLTAEAFDDGWFRTGDFGSLDDDGFLTITGRKKEIIVTAGGKNVAPAMLEDQIRAEALISQVVVIGEGKPFIAALVTLDDESLPALAESYGLSRSISTEDAATSAVIRAQVQKIIDLANESVSHAEQIKSFRIVPTDFTEQTGHLTPSLKIKRGQVLKDFQPVIEEIYSAPKPS